MLKYLLSNNAQMPKSPARIKSILGFGAILVFSSCISTHAASLDYKETKVLTLNAENIQLLNINATAGILIIKGEKGIDEIEVTAEILAYDDDIKLSLDLKGNTAILIADVNKDNTSSWSKKLFNWGSNESAKIDLIIKVPANINLKIADGSGSIEIENVNQIIALNDGSGDINITKVSDDVNINDGSGSLKVTDVGGNLNINDGSGGIVVKNIGGYVNVKDGSGSMSIAEVTGLVTIDDGSGGIEVNHLKGGLTIIEDGSGGLKMQNVKGSVTINE